MARSIHDAHLIRYTVDRAARQLRLETVLPERDAPELTDVVFRDVVAYYFEHDSFELGTILFSIDEDDGASLVDDYPNLFEAGRAYGWPGDWNRSQAEAKAHIASANLRAFLVCSSIGLGGWVLAGAVELVPHDPDEGTG